MSKLTTEQLSSIAELAGWKKGSLSLWDDGMKLHTLLELNSLDVLMEIVEKILPQIDCNFNLYSDDGYWFCYFEKIFTTERFVDSVVGVLSPVEALQLALLKYVEAQKCMS